MTEKLHTRLLPKFDNIDPQRVVEAALPLRAEFVHGSLIKHERFHQRLFERVLREEGISTKTTVGYFPMEHVLQRLVQMRPEDIARGLGLAWNARGLAKACLLGAPELTQYANKDISDALKLRESAPHLPQATLPSLAVVEEDGIACLSAWLSDVPAEISQLMRFWMRDTGEDWQMRQTGEDVSKRGQLAETWWANAEKQLESLHPEEASA